MRLVDLLGSDVPPALRPGDTVRHAAQTMNESGCKALAVCEHDRLVGVLTDWDITSVVARQADPERTSVAEVMTRDVLCAPPDATLIDASELLASRHLHHLCVSDHGGYRGMVSLDIDWEDLGGSAMPTPKAVFCGHA